LPHWGAYAGKDTGGYCALAPRIEYIDLAGWRRLYKERKMKVPQNKDDAMEFYGLPPIGQKQRRPMDGAQFYFPWVGEAGGELKRE
jgi:hypothetical protein